MTEAEVLELLSNPDKLIELVQNPRIADLFLEFATPKQRKLFQEAYKAFNSKGRQLEGLGWRKWLTTLGGGTFKEEFAFFHEEFWEWYWQITMKRRRGERLSIEDLIALLIWGRGSGKSSVTEWAAIMEGALLGQGYVLYVCASEGQAVKHLLAIKKRLESSAVAEYYPGLSKPEISAHGFRKGWSQEYLATHSGWGIIPAGLKEGIRGGRDVDLRFTLIIADDIDDFKDSPEEASKKLDVLTRSVAPSGTEDTIILFPQNLIHENSVLNQIYTRRSDAFAIRKTFGPYPSFKNLDLQLQDREDGARVWGIRSCEPLWPAFDVDTARKFLNKSGRLGFLAEYQHDFESAREGKVLRNYNDRLMVITKSDFVKKFGSWEAIDHFNKWVGHDWARTKSEYHANVCAKLAVSSQNTVLPGKLFLYDMMSFDAGTAADDVGRRLLNSISKGPERNSYDTSTWEEIIEASVSRLNLGRYITDTTRLITARREVIAAIVPQLIAPMLERKRYQGFYGSHEQSNDALQVYRTVYGFPFNPVNPGETGGLEWADHYMMVDKNTPHPFFEDELTTEGWKLGCPGMFLIVEDNKKLYPPDTSSGHLHDSDLWRFQFSNWRMRAPKLTASGEMEFGPLKMHDDCGNALMMILLGNRISNVPLKDWEMLDELTPVKYRYQEMIKESPYERGLTGPQEMSFLFQAARAKKRLERTEGYWLFDQEGERIPNDEW